MQSAERERGLPLALGFSAHRSSLITHHSPNARCEGFERSRLVTPRSQVLLWAAQRASAAILALFVIVHLATIIYAVRNGLTAAEILGRTRGNAPWAGFYALFVAALAIHVPIGLRTILSETFNWRGRSLEVVILGFGVLLALWGGRAVYAVFGAS